MNYFRAILIGVFRYSHLGPLLSQEMRQYYLVTYSWVELTKSSLNQERGEKRLPFEKERNAFYLMGGSL